MKRLNTEAVILIVSAILWLLQTPSLAHGRAEPKRISVAELKRLLDNGDNVVVVDVRSRRAYNAGHLPGAISIPFPDQIQARHRELPQDKLMVLY